MTNLCENHKPCQVTRTFLPDRAEYNNLLDEIWSTAWVTNHGPLEARLRQNLQDYLAVPNMLLCANGTLALQLALRVFGVAGGEVVTTPFSYVATSTAIVWEGAKPVFADIDYETLQPTVENIAACITDQTRAILCTHVFGLPGHVEAVENLARDRSIPMIFDAAHAFGVIYKNKSLLSYGDLSACSFHATKVFHTAEGGGLVFRDADLAEKLWLLGTFGHIGDNYKTVGLNAKMSELNAAMGLAVLPHLEAIIAARQTISECYNRCLPWGRIRRPQLSSDVQQYNYAYYPILMENEDQVLKVIKNLEGKKIFPRRYFHPSLDALPYLGGGHCPVSRDVASRILCLPIYKDMPTSVIQEVAESLNDELLTRHAFFINKNAEARTKVSVVTTAYNHENYLEDCIKSVAGQECDFPIEHIIGDDASSDRTAEIISDYASKYSHIRPILQKERTYGRGNIQAVFSAVSSPYVSICEGDDYFLDPRKLQKQATALDERPEVALCAHPVEVLYQETGEKEIFPDRSSSSPFFFMKDRNIFSLQDILKMNFIQTNSVMYRWRFPKGLPGWFNYYVMPQDWYWHILHAETGKILYQHETMSVYRRHNEGMWTSAHIDAAKHIALWAYSMLRFCQLLNRHFNDKYHTVLDELAIYYYSNMSGYYADNDPSMITYYENMFPEFAKAYVSRTAKPRDNILKSLIRKIRVRLGN
ncbi:MAG: DegT/DnrJ/EryC1/StrS family aminotransferase [Candidatus Adiutrix sp.]|jgi:dTDP-4-amino-4,6-dideoxygalactose transaminase/glycosyltransferase involved in cell wall biosynthesis|nr:DegT/DnrJ/EryC1/StrS family aminotransferase [Candidatus Adiutrix sp.]